jgi:hypothetical protein
MKVVELEVVPAYHEFDETQNTRSTTRQSL